MKQQIKKGAEGRQALVNGINQLADAVTSTLGPRGRNVIYNKDGYLISTKDGVSIAKHIEELEDPFENLGIQTIKQAAIKTADKAGDGTTTSTLLAQNMINEGIGFLDKGLNAVDIKKGIELATKEVVNELKKVISKDISDEAQITQIATVSANNDEEVGKLISTALKKVGRDGAVYIEESKTGETSLETVEGMQFDKGYKSHIFVTDNNEMSCTLENPLILICDKRITVGKELLPFLEYVNKESKPLLIVAEDVEGEALSMCIVNKMRGSIKVAAVKAPDFGDRRKLILEDMAVLTGGQVISVDKGMKLEKPEASWLGQARLVTITKDTTTIIDGKGSEEAIVARINDLKSQIEKAKTPFEQEKLQERLAKFTGGICIIHVGGNTETEMREKKDRVDDALQAAKAGIEEGILPGGGVALLYAREAITWNNITPDIEVGKRIVYNACGSPFQKILINAGYKLESIHKLQDDLGGSDVWKGYDLKSETFVNMKEVGILDPTKVTRCALENASSVAGTILLTECVIVTKEEKKEQFNPMEGM